MWRRWRWVRWLTCTRHAQHSPSFPLFFKQFPLLITPYFTMSRASNGHRSTESTWSIAAAANQGIRVHHTTPSSSNGDMGDRPQTTHVNRRSGGVFAFESDGADHRATWSGNEHGDRHAWKQGYTFVGSAVANQAANGGADSRANGSMRENGGSRRPSANGPAMQSVTNGTRGPADASLADDTRRPSPSSTARHSLSTKPVSRA